MTMNNNNNSRSSAGGGIGFVSALQIAFIVLKLCGVIKWSWLWVLAPTWISTIFFIVVLLVFYIFVKKLK